MMSANSSILERFASLNSSRKSSISKLDFTGQHYTSKISELLHFFILFLLSFDAPLKTQ